MIGKYDRRMLLLLLCVWLEHLNGDIDLLQPGVPTLLVEADQFVQCPTILTDLFRVSYVSPS